MKFFDIVGNKVTIHPDALALPPFKRVWEQDKADKVYATNLISYIILKNRYDSPYKRAHEIEKHLKSLKRTYFGNENYTLTEDEKAIEEEWINLGYTDDLAHLESIRAKMRTFTRYYLNSLDEVLDAKTIGVYNKGFKDTEGMLVSMDKLEDRVRKGELANDLKAKGDYEINRYEIPER